MKKINEGLFEYIKKSPSMFHAIDELKQLLSNNGFIELFEGDLWKLEKGKRYFTTRNGSSIIAFDIAENINNYHFQISATHSDSPTYKVKEIADIENNNYIKLNVEGYGGMIASTWFDRPLSLAGRILVNEEGVLKSKLINIDKDILMIPNVAIHMNRDVNNGYKYNNQVDLLPLFSAGKLKKEDFYKMLAREVNCDVDEIESYDLYLYNRMEPTQWGYGDEFIACPKLDNLECAYLTTKAFIDSKCNDGINIVCSFDNEEVGSGTKQGAGSTFLLDVLKRINSALGYSNDDYYAAVAKSFMLSCDNAHAVHPNHPEKTDVKNCCYLNKGIVIKYSANQKYTTDAISSAIVSKLCKDSNVACQKFVNRSDMPGGSTLGNISNAQVSLHSADIGLPQLAMHSSFEIAGSEDSASMYNLVNYFYNHVLNVKSNIEFEVK